MAYRTFRDRYLLHCQFQCHVPAAALHGLTKIDYGACFASARRLLIFEVLVGRPRSAARQKKRQPAHFLPVWHGIHRQDQPDETFGELIGFCGGSVLRPAYQRRAGGRFSGSFRSHAALAQFIAKAAAAAILLINL